MKIVAEAGCNWHTIEEAKLFIDKSKELGLFSTKFQIYNDDVIKDSEHYDFLKSIQLDYEKAKELFDYGKSIGQEVFFTPMFLEAVDWCEDIGVSMYKIRYADNQNKKLQRKIVDTNKPFLISFLPFGSGGMIWKRALILNCIPEYPAPLEKYREWGEMLYSHGHGISDHTSNLQLLISTMNNDLVKIYLEAGYNYYFEKHVKLDDDCLESKWSVTFEQLAEVLNK